MVAKKPQTETCTNVHLNVLTDKAWPKMATGLSLEGNRNFLFSWLERAQVNRARAY